MQKDTPECESALQAMIEILQAPARNGAAPLQYGELSTELARLGHHVPAHGGGRCRYLLKDASVRECSDGSLPLLSALVVLKDTDWPSTGFFKPARRPPYGRSCRSGCRGLKVLAEHYAGR